MQKSNNQIIIWLYVGCVLIFVMVVIGGITRLTGSGLSITEWKVITGSIPPMNDADWQIAFEKYQQSPQFRLINSHFGVQEFKQIYWWEYIHRLLGRLIGLVFLIPFLWFWLRKKIDKKLMPKLLIMFLLGAWQGFLGWYMVKSGLTKDPYVSHFRLAIHLVNAFITFGYLFWVAQGLQRPRSFEKSNYRTSFNRLSIIIMVLLCVQIIYGAFVAGLKAGHFYNTWPKMGEEWIASSVLIALENSGFSSLVNDISVVQFIHRTLALLVFGLVIFVWAKRNSSKWELNSSQKTATGISMFFITIQVLLGIFTLLYNVPVWLGVVHQAGAFLIFAALLYQVHRLVRS